MNDRDERAFVAGVTILAAAVLLGVICFLLLGGEEFFRDFARQSKLYTPE